MGKDQREKGEEGRHRNYDALSAQLPTDGYVASAPDWSSILTIPLIVRVSGGPILSCPVELPFPSLDLFPVPPKSGSSSQ